jgi:hypothetical protein
MPTMRTPSRCALVAGILLLLGPSTARPQEPPAATTQESADEELIAKGVALRKEGRDADALAIFERALALRPSPRAVVQIALAHQALAHWREAERGLIVALGNGNDPWIARHRTHIDESLAVVEDHLASLVVQCNIAGAEVVLGTELAGRLPLDRPLRVVAGDVTVEVRAPGYAPVHQTLHADARSQVIAAFTLVQAEHLADAATDKPEAEHPPVERPPSGPRKMGWVALAGAGGLALVGVGGLVTREWEAQIWNDDRKCAPAGGLSRSNRCGTNRDIGSAAQTTAIVAFAGAGVLAAISGALLFLRPQHAPVPAARVECGVMGIGLSCGGSF